MADSICADFKKGVYENENESVFTVAVTVYCDNRLDWLQ